MRGQTLGLVLAIAVTAPAVAAEPDFAKVFAGRDGCFELYDLKADKLVVRSDARFCAQQMSPCSTFKVPLALMAFDAGILENDTSSLKWDGVKRSREDWNHDQTAASWMQYSVVWFSQRLTPKLGKKKIEGYLTGFGFGNHDMSGGLTTAWLDSSLRISPDEQLAFWRKLWCEELPVSKHAFAMTKKITFVDESPAGWKLTGKTGSGSVGAAGPNQESGLEHGWFVGYVTKGDRAYAFVTSYADRAESDDRRPAGWIAREMAKTILGAMDLY